MAKIHAKKTGYQRKHYLSLARKSFRNWENIKQETKNNFAKHGRFQAKLGGLESLLHVVN